MNLFCCTILHICDCMYDCFNDLMVGTNPTIVKEKHSKGLALPNKSEQIKSWWEDDERCIKKSLSSMYISVKTCLILMQEIMETRIRNYSNRRSEIQFTGRQIAINIEYLWNNNNRSLMIYVI